MGELKRSICEGCRNYFEEKYVWVVDGKPKEQENCCCKVGGDAIGAEEKGSAAMIDCGAFRPQDGE